jgi:hypothetical protein
MDTANTLGNEGKEIRPVGHEQGTTAYAVEPSVVADEKTACDLAADELINTVKKYLKDIRREYVELSKARTPDAQAFDGHWDMIVTEIISALHVAGYEPDFDYISAEYKSPEFVEEYEKLLEEDA